ncbi:MAG: dethiobiotin synthase [Casimicrobiaceae bacterium]
MNARAQVSATLAAGQSARPGGAGGARGVFVTGTDTGIGKTRVAAVLLRALAASGLRAAGMKPVAAGIAPGSPVNEDVAALAAAGNVDAPLDERNPYAFIEPIAPHLAARDEGRRIELDVIARAFAALSARADAVVVEGAGGVLVPLDAHDDMLDIARALRLPVLLVVGMRLGCLNHALLSALAIRARGLPFAGWVANELPPGMPRCADNVATLARLLGVAPIATFGPGTACRFDAMALARLKLR